MAKLSTKRKGLDGRPTRPVARLLVVTPFPEDQGGDHEQRLTLRSDGSIVSQTRIPASEYSRSHWTAPHVWADAPSGRTLDEVVSLWEGRVTKYLRRRHPDVRVTPEAL